MNNRDRTIGSLSLRFSVLRTMIFTLFVLAGASGTVLAQATLTLPPERENGLALTAEKVSLLSILDDLAEQTGMVILGRQHITDRQISGRYEGDMPEVVRKLLRGETYMLVLGTPSDQGYTQVETLIFIPGSEPDLAAHFGQIDTPVQAEQLGIPGVIDTSVQAEQPGIAEVNDSPVAPPAITARLLRVISPPPLDTPERERFDTAVAKVRKELEQKLLPLINLR